MIISVEVPVFKGGWLQRCIDSVLYQTSPDWRLSLLWDGGDVQSRRILERLERRHLPNVTVEFAENRGIARARRYLSEHSEGDFILPLDDDDALPFHAVERFLHVGSERPWAAVIRGQRAIIDADGKVLPTPPWFPFEPRHYQYGMVTDLLNHTQPYLIRRAAYERTSGWEGFEDFGHAGEDCDIYLKLEEVGSIELVDEVLYYYRLHSDRASLVLTDEAAYEMWRRLADKTIERIGLPLKRVSDRPPFRYERTARARLTLEAVDFLILADSKPTRSPAADQLVGALRQAGFSANALRKVGGGSPQAFNAAFAQTMRPIVCIADPEVIIDGNAGLGALLGVMDDRDLDLAAPRLCARDGSTVWPGSHVREGHARSTARADPPHEGQLDLIGPAACLPAKLVLVRREVVKAVGGMDEGFEQVGPALIDCCLRAQQRAFQCRHVAGVAFTVASAGPDSGPPSDLHRLRQKWADRPELFERIASAERATQAARR